MKKYKIKTIFASIMLSLLSISLSFVGGIQKQEVYALSSNEYNQTQSRTFTINKIGSSNLYGSGDDTSSYYYVSNSNDRSLKDGKKTLSGDSLYLQLHYYGLSGTAGNTVTVGTKIKLGNNLVNASKNGYLNIKLLASVKSSSSDVHSMKWTNGTNSETSSTANSSSATELSMNISKLVSEDLQVDFMSKYASKTVVDYYQDLDVSNPRLIISTSDTTAPVIYDVNYAKGWSANNKTVTFRVREEQSGIQSVKVTGRNITDDNSEYTLVEDLTEVDGLYSFIAVQDFDYEIEAVDNVNLLDAYSLSQGDLKVDTTDVSRLELSDIADTHENFINFTSTFDVDPHSPEKIYYTLLALSDYNAELAMPNKNCATLKNGENTISLEDKKIGTYVLTARVIDEVGHAGKEVSKKFVFDNTRYLIKASSNHAECIISGATMINDETEYHAWRGDVITITYNVEDGYEFYKILKANGGDFDGNSEKCVFICDADVDLNVLFRYRINLVENETKTSYVFDPLGNITFEYKLNVDDVTISYESFVGDESEPLFNVGDYRLVWSIDNDDYIGGGELNISVTPLDIEITYNYSDFEYNASVQDKDFTFTHEDYPTLTFDTIYEIYNSDSDTYSSCEFKNAGKYRVTTTCTDTNYKVKNSIVYVDIAQKEIIATIGQTTFDYTSKPMNIEYSLSPVIDIDIVYKVYDEEKDEYVLSTNKFLNAGDYTFEICPIDSVNYFITGGVGIAKINKVFIHFVLERQKYDYLANNIVPDYKMLDNDGNQLDFVNNLTLTFEKDGVSNVDFLETGHYNLTFSTDDENYVLSDFYFTDLQISKTDIYIELNDDTFVYTSEKIIVPFVMKNADKEVLENVKNIYLTITFDGAEVDDVIGVGEYEYYFTKTDVCYEIHGGSGSISVVPAELTVDMLEEYEYTTGEYDFKYSFKNQKKVNFNTYPNVTLQVSDINGVGEYDYTFVSSDDNIKLINGTGTLQIIPRKLTLDIVSSYEYKGKDITFIYTCPVKELKLDVQIGILHDVGFYPYVITSLDENYEIVNGVNQVEVTKKPVSVDKLTIEYKFDKELSLDYTLSDKISCQIAGYQNGKKVDILNVGRYDVVFTSLDKNYVINHGDLYVIILPKDITISIVEESLIARYDGSGHKVIAELETEDYHIEYKYNGVVIEGLPTSAGNYQFEVIIDSENYTGGTSGQMTIQKRVATLSVSSGQKKVYFDDDTAIDFDVSNVVPGDDLQVELKRADGENVGVYPINLVSYDNTNYILEYPEIAYFEITGKKILVIADAKIKTYGDDDEELTYKIYMNDSFVKTLLGDDKLTGVLRRNVGDDVGSYDINLGTLNNPNYIIAFAKAQYKILPKDVHITIDDIVVTYGDSQELTYSLDLPIEDLMSGSLDREAGDEVGEYEINLGDLKINSNNYKLCDASGVYKITQKTLYIKAHNVEKEYGEKDELTCDIIGLVDGDVLAGGLDRVVGENVGTYDINIFTFDNSNYSIVFYPAVLTIKKAKLGITIHDVSQEYGKEPAELSYDVTGLAFGEKLDLKLFREAGDDVGVYDISCKFVALQNYTIDSLVTGKYTITKSTIIPVLTAKTFVYNGKPQVMSVDFPYDVKLIYKLNGFVVDSAVDVGIYTVQAEFGGNKNYLPSKSSAVTLSITQQYVYLTLLDNNFIYDGQDKFPQYSFDKNIGLSDNSIVYEFENGVVPKEVGAYNFVLRVNDKNFRGEIQGQIKIETIFATTNANSSIIECEDATFDENVHGLELVETKEEKKFNNEKVLSICSLKNAEKIDNSYVYTVKIKATSGVDNVHVYRVGLSGVEILAVTVDNGYYVFQVNDLDSKYFITTEEKTLNTLAWILIIVAIVLIFGVALIVVATKKHKHKKVCVEAKKEEKTKEVKAKDIDNYNID